MKNILLLTLGIVLVSCNSNNTISEKSIEGTWKLVYGSIEENDKVEVRDMDNSNFIKIINNTHFSFFNQIEDSPKSFYGGAGTYTLDGTKYVETLDYIASPNLRGHKFEFNLELKGDTLIQHGLEKVESANIDRYIVEKYIRIE